MKTSTRSHTRSAMARLSAARPPVADHTEGIVPRMDRARLLRSIMDAEPTSGNAEPTPAHGPATAVSHARPAPDLAWIGSSAPVPGPRRRVLAGALVATVVAAGLGVAGLIGGDDAAQVSAGPGEVGSSPGAPVATSPRFLPGPLPDGVVLREVAVEPASSPPPGSPHAEVYGRIGADGNIEQAVAVLTDTEPEALDALVQDSGATPSPVAGRPGEVEVDFGEGLVARSFNTGRAERACGTGGCVDIVDQEGSLTVLVMGRDLDGGTAALDDVVDNLVFAGDSPTPNGRVEAPALVTDGFTIVYEGDQVPGLLPGSGTTTLRYSDDRGQHSVALWLYEGQEFDPASLAWQFAETRPVVVRGHDGLLVANDLGTSVTWQERPGLTLSLEVAGLSENDAVDIANGVREVGEDEWRATEPVQAETDASGSVGSSGGESGASLVSSGVEPTGPTVVLGEGRAGSQRWELVGYPIDPMTGSGADTCTELRVGGTTVSASCSVRAIQEEAFTPGNYVSSLGPEKELGGQVLFRGQVHPEVANVRFLLDTGDTLEVPTAGTEEGLGTHVIAVMPAGAQGATVVLVDDAGAELQRLAFASFRPVGG